MLKLPRFSLRLRLSLSIIGIVVLFTLTNITYQISGDNRNLRLDNLQNAVQGQLTSVAIRQMLENQQNEILVLDALKQSSEARLKESEITNGIEKLDEVQAQIDLLANYVYQEGEAAYAALLASHHRLNQLWTNFYRGYNTQKTPPIADIENQFTTCLDLLNRFEVLEIQAAEQQTSELQTSSRVTDRITLVIYLFTIVLTVGLGFLLIRYTIRALNELSLGTVRIGRGDLDYHIPVNYNDEIGDLAIAFNDMADKLRNAMAQAEQSKDRADEANKAKTNFLANMSHELRTPLNAIIGYSEMIIEVYREENELDEEQAVNDLQHILSSGRHLLQLINDVLDLAKIESGNMNTFNERFDSIKIIEDLIKTMQPLAKKGNNTLLVEASTEIPKLYSDAVKFRQIFINLLSNASKFTKDGKISILITHNSYKQQVIYHVTDTGIGMSAEQLNHIFEAFVQADSNTAKEFGGTGLGLAICKQFIELMHGTLDVTSAPGEGTTFTIIMPVDVRPPRKREVIPTKNQQELGLTLDETTETDHGMLPRVLFFENSATSNQSADEIIDTLAAGHATRRCEAHDVFSQLANTEKGEPGPLADIDIAVLTLRVQNDEYFGQSWRDINILLESATNNNIDTPLLLLAISEYSAANSSALSFSENINPANRQRLTTQLRQRNPIDRRGEALLLGFDDEQSAQAKSTLAKELESEAWHCNSINSGDFSDAATARHEDLVDVVMINQHTAPDVLKSFLGALANSIQVNAIQPPGLYVIQTAISLNRRFLDRPSHEIIIL